MDSIKIISVDFQKDFTARDGFAYKPRASVDFIKNILIPFLKQNNIKIAEIISDYREIPLSSRGFFCQPGTIGYESEIPDDVKLKDAWIKCQHSPIWTRENIGIADKNPGKPYPDPEKFEKWLKSTVGEPQKNSFIILIGLTVNCCILSLAQELFFRGYAVKILGEATDDYLGNLENKKNALELIGANRWAETIDYNDFKKLFNLTNSI